MLISDLCDYHHFIKEEEQYIVMMYGFGFSSVNIDDFTWGNKSFCNRLLNYTLNITEEVPKIFNISKYGRPQLILNITGSRYKFCGNCIYKMFMIGTYYGPLFYYLCDFGFARVKVQNQTMTINTKFDYELPGILDNWND